MKKIILISLFFCSGVIMGQQWVSYTTNNSPLPSNSIYSIAIDRQNVKWIATGQGLVKFDGINWTIYNSSNSPLLSSIIRSVAVDRDNNIWIGSNDNGNVNVGIYKFNRTNWEIYTPSSSKIPNRGINSISIDSTNNIWIGTFGGAVTFDRTNWYLYNTSNSNLISEFVLSTAVDNNNIIWIGTSNGAAKFNNNNWVIYSSINSGLETSNVWAISFDNQNRKWIGGQAYGSLFLYNDTTWLKFDSTNSPLPSLPSTLKAICFDKLTNTIWVALWGNGVYKFRNNNWENYNTSNSEINTNSLNTINIDKYSNKYFGNAPGGINIFNETGIVSINNHSGNIANDYSLYKNYPNPFNPFTTIKYSLPEAGNVSIKIYDLSGKLVKNLLNEFKSAGNYEVKFDGSDFSSGVYFYKMETEGFTDTKRMILIK